MVGLIAAALILALTFRLPGGADVSRWLILLSALVVALLVGLALAFVVFAFLRPRDGR
jgi:amino acid transporter